MRKLFGWMLPLAALGVAGSANAQIVINEILANPGSEFDGAEFIELHNPTGSAVSIAGWVLSGTEFDGTCGGEDQWQFPAGASIPAGGYVVVAKDNTDPVTEEEDGFFQRFGFNADFEMYDADRFFELDDPAVPNLAILTNSGFDDQIGLIPGSGYGAACSGTFNQYEALYLYNGIPGGGGTVVDVIEYRDATTCLSDVCLGVGTSDNDAFVGLPGVGQSLGRDASSTDTGNSGNDLSLQGNTPGAVNIANIPPALANLSIDNPDPLSSEVVNVTIDATDADGIGGAWVVYSVNGGAADSSSMSLTGVDQYTGAIPAQNDGDNVTYFVRVADGGAPAATSKFPDFGSRSLRWGTQTIFSVQFHSPPSDTGQSSEVGNAVNIQGIVTTEPGLYSDGAFTVQNGTGFWSGVTCFDFTSSTSVQRGDEVRVSGEVGEFFDLTQVQFFGSENVEVLSAGNALPAPFAATASQLTTGSTFGELLEGVYTEINDVEVTLADDGFGQWNVTDASGTALIGDDAFYLYSPTLGDSLDTIRGITYYSFSERKIEPRDSNDILGPPLVSSLRYSPCPPLPGSPVNFSVFISDNGTIARAKLIFALNGGAPDSTDLVDGGGGNFGAAIGPFAAGTVIDYRVEVTDDDGFTGRQPAIGDFDVRVGYTAISAIQGTYKAGSDSSAFEGEPHNVTGIVTQAPGTLADNIFVIQNSTANPDNDGIHIFSGGSLVGELALGDSVSICGDVDEFFGLTQIRMHFTDAYEHHGFVGEIEGFELASTAFPRDSTGAVPASEPYEGVLVQFSNSVITNSAAGFGQFTLDNVAPLNAEDVLVDDEARVSGFSFEPTFGDSVTVRGIGDFSFGEYKVQPRDDSDILPYDPADATDVTVGPGAALNFALHQNTPNPFSIGSTRIAFALPREGKATLRVFDVQGRLVQTLVDGALPAGQHQVTWDGRNSRDGQAAAGVYFYRLQTDQGEATKKMLLIR